MNAGLTGESLSEAHVNFVIYRNERRSTYAVGQIDELRDGEVTIELGVIGVRHNDGNGVGITRVKRPRDYVAGVLNPSDAYDFSQEPDF